MLGLAWVLFITQAAPWSEAMNFVVGVGVLAAIFLVTMVWWTGYTGRMDLWEDQSKKNRGLGRVSHDEQEYLRRRAEDARMRELMNPNSKQAPDTDRWYG